jgi:hypothetical protein
MFQAALKEIRTSPLASLGALVGVASFVVVLLASDVEAGTGATAPYTSVAAAVAFAKLALVVPGTAFFFAFLGHLFFAGGTIRGSFVTLVLFLVSELLTATATGLILSPFPKHTGVGGEQYVLDINYVAISLTLYVANLLIFAGVVGEYLATRSTTAPESEVPAEEEDEEAGEDQEDLGGFWGFVFMVSLFGFLISSFFAASLGHSVLKACLAIGV